MTSKKFAADLIEEMLEGCDHNGITVVSRKKVLFSRWTGRERSIFKYDEKFYQHEWAEPMTEMQEVDRNIGDVECKEVFPHTVRAVEWRDYKQEGGSKFVVVYGGSGLGSFDFSTEEEARKFATEEEDNDKKLLLLSCTAIKTEDFR